MQIGKGFEGYVYTCTCTYTCTCMLYDLYMYMYKSYNHTWGNQSLQKDECMNPIPSLPYTCTCMLVQCLFMWVVALMHVNLMLYLNINGNVICSYICTLHTSYAHA